MSVVNRNYGAMGLIVLAVVYCLIVLYSLSSSSSTWLVRMLYKPTNFLLGIGDYM